MENIQFSDDKTIKNIEIAAGCGNFGKLYYAKCYLTDKDEKLKEICKNCAIDFFYDAHKLPWSANRFDNIIICNPYGFGFDDDENAALLLDELVRVSQKNGTEIVLLCHDSNKYCKPNRVKKRVDTYLQNKPNLQLILKVQDLEAQKEYPNYTFYTSDGTPTLPNFKITLHVIQ